MAAAFSPAPGDALPTFFIAGVLCLIAALAIVTIGEPRQHALVPAVA